MNIFCLSWLLVFCLRFIYWGKTCLFYNFFSLHTLWLLDYFHKGEKIFFYGEVFLNACNCYSIFFFYILFWSLPHPLKMFAYCLMNFFLIITKGREVYVIYRKIGNYVVKEWDMIHIAKEENYNSKYANIEKYWNWGGGFFLIFKSIFWGGAFTRYDKDFKIKCF